MVYAVRHGVLVFLPLSIGCAFVFAVAFVIVLTLTLPATDAAYGQAPFADPLVFPVMSAVAFVAGLVTWLPMYLALRRRRLMKSVGWVLGVTLGWIVCLTPVAPGLGFPGSFVGFAVAVLIARRICRPTVPPGFCAACGYNLTGNVSGRCPECGQAIEPAVAEQP